MSPAGCWVKGPRRKNKIKNLDSSRFIGFSVRCSKDVTPDKSGTCEAKKEPLTPQLTPEFQKQPGDNIKNLSSDLAEIVAVWPELPEYIKATAKALVQIYDE